MAFSFADFFKSELAASLFASSGSQPLQTELCENPNFITQGYHADAFRGRVSVIHIAHAHWHCILNLTLKSYPTRCGCLPNRSRVLAKPQLKRMNKAEGRDREWLPTMHAYSTRPTTELYVQLLIYSSTFRLASPPTSLTRFPLAA